MKKSVVIIIAAIALIAIFTPVFMIMNENKKSEIKIERKTIEIESSEGLTIKADIYETKNSSDPLILLFHQAGYSRGEYRSIAPILNELGFACIAIDQRSGREVNSVVNETNIQAIEKGLPTNYVDALPDLEATLKYAKSHFPNRKIVIWGSSYSASLVFILGSRYKSDIQVIISFSPGEYFEYENSQIQDYAKVVDCPVFITSAKSEYKYWKSIYEYIKSPLKASFVPNNEGYHGSRALWKTNPGNEEYWNALSLFLNKIKN